MKKRSLESFGLKMDGELCSVGADPPRSDTPTELIFPAQYPFSWTLRGARARRLRENTAPAVTHYRIAGCAHGASEVAAAIAFCERHNATLEILVS